MADADSPRAAGPNGPVAANHREPEERWFDRLLTAFGLRASEGLRENLAQALIEDAAGEDAIFSAEERRLLQNILSLRDVRILDVMIPRADIDSVPETISLGDLMKTFREAGHSRLPVYRETLDDPVGFVHAKDVMIRVAEEAMDEDAIRLGSVDLSRPLSEMDILRPILFVPPSMPAMDLMVRMQANRTQLALVVDEYGGTDGLVSLEDLIETVVGDIEDEYDWPDEPTVIQAEDGAWIADARLDIDDFQEEAGITFPEAEDLFEDVDTLGGIVFALLGRVPVRGEIVTSEQLPGVEFEVLEADLRRIKRVKVTVHQEVLEERSHDAA
ncbi:hemolysin family protein [Acuticoccus sp. I52.16.1]|uniref:hemolysin family protein n=1 Tax=Acuticoccus sp. I52.16.1 TaxID=2928472 RepID=UPI001FD6052A|nr:hemolysin family protein [Acuticoccus sp. I52.16.1]UOM33588.1 hemolysin family protein [Acuticoccus sp. I52.16.1]